MKGHDASWTCWPRDLGAAGAWTWYWIALWRSISLLTTHHLVCSLSSSSPSLFFFLLFVVSYCTFQEMDKEREKLSGKKSKFSKEQIEKVGLGEVVTRCHEVMMMP